MTHNITETNSPRKNIRKKLKRSHDMTHNITETNSPRKNIRKKLKRSPDMTHNESKEVSDMFEEVFKGIGIIIGAIVKEIEEKKK